MPCLPWALPPPVETSKPQSQHGQWTHGTEKCHEPTACPHPHPLPAHAHTHYLPTAHAHHQCWPMLTASTKASACPHTLLAHCQHQPMLTVSVCPHPLPTHCQHLPMLTTHPLSVSAHAHYPPTTSVCPHPLKVHRFTATTTQAFALHLTTSIHIPTDPI